jgi:hypothetical protein
MRCERVKAPGPWLVTGQGHDDVDAVMREPHGFERGALLSAAVPLHWTTTLWLILPSLTNQGFAYASLTPGY